MPKTTESLDSLYIYIYINHDFKNKENAKIGIIGFFEYILKKY